MRDSTVTIPDTEKTFGADTGTLALETEKGDESKLKSFPMHGSRWSWPAIVWHVLLLAVPGLLSLWYGLTFVSWQECQASLSASGQATVGIHAWLVVNGLLDLSTLSLSERVHVFVSRSPKTQENRLWVGAFYCFRVLWLAVGCGLFNTGVHCTHSTLHTFGVTLLVCECLLWWSPIVCVFAYLKLAQ